MQYKYLVIILIVVSGRCISMQEQEQDDVGCRGERILGQNHNLNPERFRRDSFEEQFYSEHLKDLAVKSQSTKEKPVQHAKQ